MIFYIDLGFHSYGAEYKTYTEETMNGENYIKIIDDIVLSINEETIFCKIDFPVIDRRRFFFCF